jgi:hypothetical protein
MGRLSPQTIDLLIITIIEALGILAKHSKGEEITDEELRLEIWQETVERIKKEYALK